MFFVKNIYFIHCYISKIFKFKKLIIYIISKQLKNPPLKMDFFVCRKPHESPRGSVVV